MKARRYENGDKWVEVHPGFKGLATIYDKDILIYCISQLIAKMKEGVTPSPYVKIVAKDLLIFINRSVGGKDYDAEFGTRMRGTGPWAQMLRDRFNVAVNRLGFSRERQPLDLSQFVAPAAPVRPTAASRPAEAAGQGSLF